MARRGRNRDRATQITRGMRANESYHLGRKLVVFPCSRLAITLH